MRLSVQLVFAMASAGLLPLHTAQAAEAVSCRIPQVLLCEGCARELRISVGGGGECTVTFKPGAASEQTRATAGTGMVTVMVEPLRERVFVPRPGADEERVARRPHFAGPGAGRPRPRCFSYNGQEFC